MEITRKSGLRPDTPLADAKARSNTDSKFLMKFEILGNLALCKFD